MRTELHCEVARIANRPIRLRLRRIAGIVIVLGCMNVAAPRGALAQGALPEYEVKAAYLYNFLKFVEWPEHTFADSLAPIVIGIVGGDPFGSSLPQVVIGKTIQGRDLVIREYREGENLRGAQILFINTSEKKYLRQILAGLRGASVLTVADMSGFVEEGGMIEFLSEDNHVRFAINVDAANKAHLKISSRLLSLARVVGTP